MSALGCCQSIFADELKLKRSCLKQNPLAAGISDPTLIEIYTQRCDKKNKDNQNAYLVQAAQRLQQLGLNYRAIQLVNELEQQQVQSSTLTDVKFLIGAKFANDALAHMRQNESRYSTQNLTYPAAKNLADHLQKTMPIDVVHNSSAKKAKPKLKVTAVSKVQSKKTTQQKAQRSKTPVSSPKAAVNPVAVSTTQNPFGSLVKTP